MGSKVNDDGEFAAVSSVVSQRGAKAGRPTPAGVCPALLMEGGGAEVVMTGGEQVLIQHITHRRGVAH